jgi:membrane protein implicated in regulation of membrane protease activity
VSAARRVAVNLSFALAFFGGLAFVWAGLGTLIFGGAGAAAGLASLAAGFGVWTALALATDVALRRERGGRR